MLDLTEHQSERDAESSTLAPLISIVIPAFNVAPYLEACLTTVLREVDAERSSSRTDFEIILVDDCSDDGSAALAQALLHGRHDAHIATHERNRGLAGARNTGINASRGRYILFLDSDNVLLDGALRRVVTALSEYPDADVIILGMDLIDVRGTRLGVFYGNRAPRHPLEYLENHPLQLLDGNILDNFSLIRSSTVRSTQYDESLRRLEDWDLWIRLRHEHQCKFAIIEDSIGGYRIRPGQLTQEHTPNSRPFFRTMLQIYAKALAMAMRMDLQSSVVERLTVNLQNCGSAYLRLLANSATTTPQTDIQADRTKLSSHTNLSTLQAHFRTKSVPITFRTDSVHDKSVISMLLQHDDYNITCFSHGQRFLKYYLSTVNSKPGLIIDSGASIGASTVYFLEIFRDSFVVALEPGIEDFEILEMNTRAYKSKVTFRANLAANHGEVRSGNPVTSGSGLPIEDIPCAQTDSVETPTIAVRSILREMTAFAPMIFKCALRAAEAVLFPHHSEWVHVFPVVIVELPDPLFPFSTTSRNLISDAYRNHYDFIQRGRNVFLFNRQLLPAS